MITNLNKGIKPLFHSIIGEMPNQQGPSIVSLLRRWFITKVFKKQFIKGVYRLWKLVVQKKIRAQQKKMAKGERVRFHEKNIEALKKVQELVSRILECDSVDEQFISQIVTIVFSQIEENTGRNGREVIQQNKITKGINKIRNDIFQQKAALVRQTSGQGQAINALDENQPFINPPLLHQNDVELRGPFLEMVMPMHQQYSLQQSNQELRLVTDSRSKLSFQEKLFGHRFDATPVLIFDLDEQSEYTFGVQYTAKGIFQ